MNKIFLSITVLLSTLVVCATSLQAEQSSINSKNDMTKHLVENVEVAHLSDMLKKYPLLKKEPMRLILSEAKIETGTEIKTLRGGTKESKGQILLLSYKYKNTSCKSHGFVDEKISENKTFVSFNRMYCTNGLIAEVHGVFYDKEKMLGAITSTFIDGKGRTLSPQEGFVSFEVFGVLKNPTSIMEAEKASRAMKEAEKLLATPMSASTI